MLGKNAVMTYKVRSYTAEDLGRIRSLQLAAYGSWRRADLVDLDALLVAEHPGFVVLEKAKGVFACGICSPDFATKEVSLWGHAAEVIKDIDSVYAELNKVLIAVLPVEDAPYRVIQEGLKEREDFFTALGFDSIGPVATDFGISRDLHLFAREVSADDIQSLREEFGVRKVLLPLNLFTNES